MLAAATARNRCHSHFWITYTHVIVCILLDYASWLCLRISREAVALRRAVMAEHMAAYIAVAIAIYHRTRECDRLPQSQTQAVR